MDEHIAIYRKIRIYTLIFMMICVIVSILIFRDDFINISLGIVIGSLTGIIGFHMIISMSEKIDENSVNVNRGSYQAYVKRYAIYAIIFILSASRGIPVLALLAGMLCHKASIVLVTILDTKGG